MANNCSILEREVAKWKRQPQQEAGKLCLVTLDQEEFVHADMFLSNVGGLSKETGLENFLSFNICEAGDKCCSYGLSDALP